MEQEDGLTHDAGDGVLLGTRGGSLCPPRPESSSRAVGPGGRADRMRDVPTDAVSLAPSPSPCSPSTLSSENCNVQNSIKGRQFHPMSCRPKAAAVSVWQHFICWSFFSAEFIFLHII